MLAIRARLLALLVLVTLVAPRAQAASVAAPPHAPIHAARATGPMHCDGVLNEASWAEAEPVTEFYQQTPDQGAAVTMKTEFKPGIVLSLKPFPGTFAVGPDPNEPKEKAGPPIHDAKGRTSTLRPWKNGSNMDVNELQEGSTLFLPVFVKGGLIWIGDSHCLQGNGEVNLTALECSYREIDIQPIVRKDLHIEWPRAETATHWIFMGFDEDLNEAMKIAVRGTVDFLAEQKMVPMSREEAYALTSMVGDCRVSEVVDIRKGVHCMVPKSIFVKKPASRSLN